MITPQPGGPAIYARIAARLRQQILSGHYRPGLPLPSERTLGEEFGVARETVRKALNVLHSEGLLVRRSGQAVEVREQPERQDLVLPAGSSVIARMPTLEERAEHGISEGVPILSVTHDDGRIEIYAADQWSVRVTR